MDGTRVSIWFETQKDFYSGTVSYDTEFSAELATEGKAADNDADAPPLHYLLKYDDGDQEHVSWSTIQIGIRNLVSGGFIEVAHLHELPSGTLNPDTGKQWTLRDATAADLVSISVPKFAEMEDLIEDVDGCGYQFQGQTNAGRVARSASSAIAVRRKSNICVPGHGKNHADHEGFTMAENVKELTLSSEAPVLSGSRSVVLALAQFRPEPTQTHEPRDSPWAPKEVSTPSTTTRC